MKKLSSRLCSKSVGAHRFQRNYFTEKTSAQEHGIFDMLSKIAAIATPIILGIGGWYFSDLSSEREFSIKKFTESASLLSSISSLDIQKQRDFLFSLIEMDRPDLMRKSVSYLNADIEYQHDLRLRDLEVLRFSASDKDEWKKKVWEENKRFEKQKEDLFFPIMLAAIAAVDVKTVKILADNAPTIVSLNRLVRVDNDLIIPESPLDFAIGAKSLELIEYFMGKGIKPYYWSVNRAIDTHDEQILEIVARKLGTDDGKVTRPIWAHAAKNATASQINLLGKLGLASSKEAAKGNPSFIAIAASEYKPENVKALAELGFPILDISEEFPIDLMSRFSRTYLGATYDLFDIPKDKLFAATLEALCKSYKRAGITEEIIKERQSFLRKPDWEGADKDSIFGAIFHSHAWNVLDCAADIFAFRAMSASEKSSLIRWAFSEPDGIKRLVESGFIPLDLLDHEGRNLALQATFFGDMEALKFLARRHANFKQLDRNGKGVFSALFDSGINKIDEKFPSLNYVMVSNLIALSNFLVQQTGIEFADKKGRTPILLAADTGQWRVISELLKYKPNLNVVTADGESVLSILSPYPRQFIELYNMGARSPGTIWNCDNAIALLEWIDKNTAMYRPENATGWDPAKAVKAAATHCQFEPGNP